MMSSLHHQVDEVLLYSHQIDGLIGSLETCEYRQPTFRELLDQLQKMIDDLNLRSYSNLSQWVSDLDKQVSGGCVNHLVSDIMRGAYNVHVAAL